MAMKYSLLGFAWVGLETGENLAVEMSGEADLRAERHEAGA